MMKYLEGEALSDEEINQGLHAGVKLGKVYPVYCGSATKNIGVQPLLDAMVDLLPLPCGRSGRGYQRRSLDGYRI